MDAGRLDGGGRMLGMLISGIPREDEVLKWSGANKAWPYYWSEVSKHCNFHFKSNELIHLQLEGFSKKMIAFDSTFIQTRCHTLLT